MRKEEAEEILKELSCFIYRRDEFYDEDNYKNDLSIIMSLEK